MKSLSWDEARGVVAVLEQVGQPFLAQELARISNLQYDGDLTGLPVSNTSRTYPNTAFGHMSDEIRLGYQAGCYTNLFFAVFYNSFTDCAKVTLDIKLFI